VINSHLYPKNFWTAPKKTPMLTCQITLPNSPHTVIISKKIPDFGHFISLARINSLFSFNKYKKSIFPFLAAGFCLKNLAFAQKMMVLPECGSPSLLALTPMDRQTDRRHCRTNSYCVQYNRLKISTKS